MGSVWGVIFSPQSRRKKRIIYVDFGIQYFDMYFAYILYDCLHFLNTLRLMGVYLMLLSLLRICPLGIGPNGELGFCEKTSRVFLNRWHNQSKRCIYLLLQGMYSQFGIQKVGTNLSNVLTRVSVSKVEFQIVCKYNSIKILTSLILDAKKKNQQKS